MSIAWMTRIWRSQEPRRSSHRLLLLALADNANDEGICWPSLRTLSKKCVDDRRDVQRRLDWLDVHGFIECEIRPGRSTVYRLLGDALVPHQANGGDTTPTRDTTPARTIKEP